MYHRPDYATFKFIGHGTRATARTNCKSCGKRIQWKGGQEEFFFGKTPEGDRRSSMAETWNTKSDFWRIRNRIDIKGCETIRN